MQKLKCEKLQLRHTVINYGSLNTKLKLLEKELDFKGIVS
jgi:hypothetical protein